MSAARPDSGPGRESVSSGATSPRHPPSIKTRNARMLRRLLAMSVLASVHFHAIAAEPAGNPDAFLSQADCFEATPDYESWLQSIPETIGGRKAPRELVAKIVPARAFAFARSGFDCRVVTYASDGHVVSGYVIRPKPGTADGKRPL